MQHMDFYIPGAKGFLLLFLNDIKFGVVPLFITPYHSIIFIITIVLYI